MGQRSSTRWRRGGAGDRGELKARGRCLRRESASMNSYRNARNERPGARHLLLQRISQGCSSPLCGAMLGAPDGGEVFARQHHRDQRLRGSCHRPYLNGLNSRVLRAAGLGGGVTIRNHALVHWRALGVGGRWGRHYPVRMIEPFPPTVRRGGAGSQALGNR